MSTNNFDGQKEANLVRIKIKSLTVNTHSKPNGYTAGEKPQKSQKGVT
jgi:hypothetical protein